MSNPEVVTRARFLGYPTGAPGQWLQYIQILEARVDELEKLIASHHNGAVFNIDAIAGQIIEEVSQRLQIVIEANKPKVVVDNTIPFKRKKDDIELPQETR